jgi:hypothetical protein
MEDVCSPETPQTIFHNTVFVTTVIPEGKKKYEAVK